MKLHPNKINKPNLNEDKIFWTRNGWIQMNFLYKV